MITALSQPVRLFFLLSSCEGTMSWEIGNLYLQQQRRERRAGRIQGISRGTLFVSFRFLSLSPGNESEDEP